MCFGRKRLSQRRELTEADHRSVTLMKATLKGSVVVVRMSPHSPSSIYRQSGELRSTLDVHLDRWGRGGIGCMMSWSGQGSVDVGSCY